MTPVHIDTIDTLTRAVDDALGRMTVLERLCLLMAANADDGHPHVDFGGVNEAAFWHGLSQLAHRTVRGLEDIQTAGHELWDAVNPAVITRGGTR